MTVLLPSALILALLFSCSKLKNNLFSNNSMVSRRFEDILLGRKQLHFWFKLISEEHDGFCDGSKFYEYRKVWNEYLD